MSWPQADLRLLLQAQLQVQLAVEDGIAGLRDDIRSLHLDVLRNSQIQQVQLPHMPESAERALATAVWQSL